MKNVEIEITGVSPLLHHRMPHEALIGLLGAKSSRKKDKPNEDKLPRDIAEAHAYKAENGQYYIPSEYITSAFIHIASDYKQASSSRKSLKGIAGGAFTPLTDSGMLTDLKNKPLKNFEVDIRKGTNHLKGAIAICRPRFDEWKTVMQFQVDEHLIPVDLCHQMLNDAGVRAGIGSFRVSCKGRFGKFRITKFKVIA